MARKPDASTPPRPDTLPTSGDLRSILDSISDAIFVYDGATAALIDVNSAASVLWGRSREDILSLDIAALSCSQHPFTHEQAGRFIERSREEGPQATHWLARHTDGHVFWVEARASFSHVGGRERYFVTIRDISRRKAAEDLLAASEATYRGLLDSVHEEICVQDADGKLLDLNEPAERLFGLPREKLIGHSPAEFAAIGLNDFPRMHAAVRESFSGHPQLFEFWCRRADGRLLPREVSVTPGKYFDKPAAIAVLRDITDRKEVETERERASQVLRESEERFRLLLGRVPTVAVQGYSADGTVRYWNEASERIYGYSAGEALGRNLVDLIIPPEMREDVRHAVRTMVETGQPIPAGELGLMRKDGTIVSVFSCHAVVRTAHGGSELYCLDIDLTDRKRSEQERLDLQQRLLRTEKLESLAVLAGGVAHDFNNLLTAILGNLDLARMELPPGSPALVSIDSAHGASRAAAELARQMLAFSGRSRMAMAEIDLNAFIEEQVIALRPEMPRGLALWFTPGESGPRFAADSDQVRQVVRNLVLNAAEAARDVPDPRIDVHVSCLECDANMLDLSRAEQRPAPGMFVAIDVIDNGSGMTEEVQRRMFEPFFTTRFAGRGLGLAVVMGVIRSHRGAILVRSKPGHGASVRVLFPAPAIGAPKQPVSLPVAAPADRAPPAPAPAQPALSRRPLLLLVDDDQFVRMVFTRMAPLLGLDLVAAETGEEAVRMFQPRAADFSVVILDLTLPGMTGWECHSILHALRPNLPIIISSGAAADAADREFIGKDIAGVLPKPFTIDGLQLALEAAGIRARS